MRTLERYRDEYEFTAATFYLDIKKVLAQGHREAYDAKNETMLTVTKYHNKPKYVEKLTPENQVVKEVKVEEVKSNDKSKKKSEP